MILNLFLILLLAGGIAAWAAEQCCRSYARWIALITLILCECILGGIWLLCSDGEGKWMLETQAIWIPSLGIQWHLAMDGLSMILVDLTLFLGILSVLTSWNEIQERVGFYYFNIMWVLAGIVGVFLALDMFLFYFFWELMLVPMYFLIAIWGHENRYYAAIKFFLFTQLSGLIMLAAIIGAALFYQQTSGEWSFNLENWKTISFLQWGPWLMWGFLIAFLVKLPAVPVHTWLPDAHTEAPTAGSVILAGLLLKTGAYGLIRFVLPLFPEAVSDVAPLLMFIGAIGILYGAWLAFAQTDLKRLVAYTSVSHMGFVLVGVFALNQTALHGTIMQMVCHSLSTGALFILVGFLYERLHTRDMREMGGFWRVVPKMGAAAMIFAMASLGLPGLGNFVGEFLVLLGAYQYNVLVTVIAAVGLILAPIYALWLMQNVFQGDLKRSISMPDLNVREWIVFGSLIISLLWLGVYPNTLFNIVDPVVDGLLVAPEIGITEQSIEFSHWVMERMTSLGGAS